MLSRNMFKKLFNRCRGKVFLIILESIHLLSNNGSWLPSTTLSMTGKSHNFAKINKRSQDHKKSQELHKVTITPLRWGDLNEIAIASISIFINMPFLQSVFCSCSCHLLPFRWHFCIVELPVASSGLRNDWRRLRILHVCQFSDFEYIQALDYGEPDRRRIGVSDASVQLFKTGIVPI